ncbi:hypothetical protein KAI56_04225 [Candidatus Parcubacteria bacterium]|nr:hypothetical protein [Candidatus Parcubacteria bacterium]
MNKWKIGLTCGVVLGIIGTYITHTTGDISLISIPVVFLFSIFGFGLLFLFPVFELVITVIFYSLIGMGIGYLIDRFKK